MVKPAEKSNKPFFTKLGFFTKKGYVVYLSYFLLIDYIYVLIVGKDKLQVLQFGMPYTVTSLVIYHIVFFGGLYVFSKINSFFGIDFSEKKYEQDLPTPLLSPLFTENPPPNLEEKTLLLSELQTLKQMIIDIEGILT